MFIPEKIKSAKLLKELRKFSRQNETLFNSNRNEFIQRCLQYFNSNPYNLDLTQGDFKPVEKSNSGVVDYRDASIEEILEAIRELLKNIRNFLAIEENAIVARSLGDRLYLRDKSDIPRPLGLSTETVQNSLNQLNEFNKDFMTVATEYFQALFNPKNEYDATILKILNFKSCGMCYQNIDTSNLYDEQMIKQYDQKQHEKKDSDDYYVLENLLTF
jgi:chaperonin cofactor prefoldin